jgi:hypothetical protein
VKEGGGTLNPSVSNVRRRRWQMDWAHFENEGPKYMISCTCQLEHPKKHGGKLGRRKGRKKKREMKIQE